MALDGGGGDGMDNQMIMPWLLDDAAQYDNENDEEDPWHPDFLDHVGGGASSSTPPIPPPDRQDQQQETPSLLEQDIFANGKQDGYMSEDMGDDLDDDSSSLASKGDGKKRSAPAACTSPQVSGPPTLSAVK